MMLEKTTDTTVRGVVYEAAGTVAADVLAGGAPRPSTPGARTRSRYALLEADPADRAAWLAAARAAIDGLLARAPQRRPRERGAAAMLANT